MTDSLHKLDQFTCRARTYTVTRKQNLHFGMTQKLLLRRPCFIHEYPLSVGLIHHNAPICFPQRLIVVFHGSHDSRWVIQRLSIRLKYPRKLLVNFGHCCNGWLSIVWRDEIVLVCSAKTFSDHKTSTCDLQRFEIPSFHGDILLVKSHTTGLVGHDSSPGDGGLQHYLHAK